MRPPGDDLRLAYCAMLLLAVGLTTAAPLATPAVGPVDVDVHQDGFLVCAFVTTSHPLPPSHQRVCTVP